MISPSRLATAVPVMPVTRSRKACISVSSLSSATSAHPSLTDAPGYIDSIPAGAGTQQPEQHGHVRAGIRFAVPSAAAAGRQTAGARGVRGGVTVFLGRGRSRGRRGGGGPGRGRQGRASAVRGG